MKKCIFFLPYFGKFPGYFNLFLRSCETNTSYDWLIFTDDKESYNYPANVKVIYLTLGDLKKIFENRIGKDISLTNSYKLCDFKPTYGYVFSEYVKNYDYWGHCDCDLIFGDLNGILTPMLEEGYDKLFAAGHLTIYKNNPVNNRRFMSKYHGRLLYKEFLTVPEICWFDEDWKKDNIHSIFLEQKAKVYCESLSFNPSEKYAFFIQRIYIPSERRYVEEKYKKALYLWAEGKIIRQFENNGKLVADEYLYMHFQQREMALNNSALISRVVQIIPNKFIPASFIPDTLSEWKRIKKEPITAYLHILELKRKRIVRRLKKFGRKN